MDVLECGGICTSSLCKDCHPSEKRTLRHKVATVQGIFIETKYDGMMIQRIAVYYSIMITHVPSDYYMICNVGTSFSVTQELKTHQDVTVTNDGATILEKMDVNHQASEASVLPKHLGP